MAGDLVLLTGATGHLGYEVLKQTLEQGYQVRAAVRSAAKGEAVRNQPTLKALNRDSQLDFVVVPDFLVPNAFDEAAKGVKYIIHVASPITTGVADDADHQALLIEPAVKGTLGVFTAAAKSPSVKRIVVTSSIVAIATPQDLFVTGTDQTITSKNRIPTSTGPFPQTMVAYAASKAAAFNATEAWIAENKPAFDAIHIHPTFILGRDDLSDTLEKFLNGGTNLIPLGLALGNKDGLPAGAYGINAVKDTARLHVDSLDPKIPGNQSFISSNDSTSTWDDVTKIIAKNFPNEVASGVFPNNFTPKTLPIKLDVSNTEETFGYKTTDGLEEAIVSVLKHFLELGGGKTSQ